MYTHDSAMNKPSHHYSLVLDLPSLYLKCTSVSTSLLLVVPHQFIFTSQTYQSIYSKSTMSTSIMAIWLDEAEVSKTCPDTLEYSPHPFGDKSDTRTCDYWHFRGTSSIKRLPSGQFKICTQFQFIPSIHSGPRSLYITLRVRPPDATVSNPYWVTTIIWLTLLPRALPSPTPPLSPAFILTAEICFVFIIIKFLATPDGAKRGSDCHIIYICRHSYSRFFTPLTGEGFRFVRGQFTVAQKKQMEMNGHRYVSFFIIIFRFFLTTHRCSWSHETDILFSSTTLQSPCRARTPANGMEIKIKQN